MCTLQRRIRMHRTLKKSLPMWIILTKILTTVEAKSPLARQKLARQHYRDVQSALGSTAYFVTAPGKDLDWLVQYYQKRKITVTPVCADQIRTASSEIAFEVYQLIRN